MDTGVNEEMARKMGFDFSHVRIHTDDLAIHTNKRLSARAFTHGSDIYFNEGEYRPNTSGGKKLIAHELTHVVQQSGVKGNSVQRDLIQRTTVGEVLNEFFSPFSSEKLWVMPANDNYTRIVRRWQPVIDAVNQAKANLEANPADWSANHRTDPAWTPGMTDPPVVDPHSYRVFVPSPPGTDPDTCRNAFIIYVGSMVGGGLLAPVFPMIPSVQTFELYTCSIGSFNIYVTVDSIDVAAGTAQLNIWMYNAMSRRSFGKFASHPAFRLSGMEKQYMWWHWTETHRWGPGAPPPAPPTPPARDWTG